jgi:hypothetical protein
MPQDSRHVSAAIADRIHSKTHTRTCTIESDKDNVLMKNKRLTEVTTTAIRLVSFPQCKQEAIFTCR